MRLVKHLEFPHGNLLAGDGKAPLDAAAMPQLIFLMMRFPGWRPHPELHGPLEVDQRLTLTVDRPAPTIRRLTTPLRVDGLQRFRLPPVQRTWPWSVPLLSQQPVDRPVEARIRIVAIPPSSSSGVSLPGR